MKELSIEEKAKRYNKAFIKSRKFLTLCEKCGAKDTIEFIEDIFPELKMDKESEDEKIRKEILNYIDNATECKRWVAWLEKQGNTNIFDVPKISIKNAVEVTSRMQYIDDDIKPIAEFIIDYANWNLHKDEWNQPTLTVPLFRVLDALIQKGKPYCACNQNIEKQGEQKPADKIEPKFKVGDWIVHQGTGYIYQVVAVINNYNKYVLKYGDNYTIQTCTDIDKRTRLWTIQDAKKGDVLVDYCDDLYNPLIFVLNKVQHVDFGLVKPSDCSSICYLRASKNQEFMLGYYHHLHNVKPATKEQIDLLFGKMKKEGYKLDANYNVVEI